MVPTLRSSRPCGPLLRQAACSSRVILGDLAGLPLLMNAPRPHCEQISTRGSDAVVAPTCPQFGQTSGEHERDYRRSGRGRKSVKISVNRSGSMFATMRHAFTAGADALCGRRCLRRQTQGILRSQHLLANREFLLAYQISSRPQPAQKGLGRTGGGWPPWSRPATLVDAPTR